MADKSAKYRQEIQQVSDTTLLVSRMFVTLSSHCFIWPRWHLPQWMMVDTAIK